ncbi:MAG: hypothetical protein IPN24_06170 [Betaproteobacteria bacterium]|nr:hypothetical protein [Betaproteobacteria bacterium]
MTVDPRRHWESPATHAVHPVGCRIDAPEFDLVLDFEPLADDQEVPSWDAAPSGKAPERSPAGWPDKRSAAGRAASSTATLSCWTTARSSVG